MIKKLILPLALLLSVVTFTGCKKVQDKLAESLLMKLITDNDWLVTHFSVDGNDITNDFIVYYFDFYDNGKVFAIKNGVQEYVGTWNPDETTKTITANFPTATDPVKKLNGVWHITKTGLNPNYVEAKLTTSSGENLKLKLNSK